MDQPDTHAQRDQQEWLAVADFEDEEEAGRDAARRALRELPAAKVIDDVT